MNFSPDDVEVSLQPRNLGGMRVGMPPGRVIARHKVTGLWAASVHRPQHKAKIEALALLELLVEAYAFGSLPGDESVKL